MDLKRIRYYRVKGTHYECAHTVGLLTRDAILQRIQTDFDEFSNLFNFIQRDYARKIQEEFIDKIRLLYPWYWDEFVGLSNGSNIPLEQILVLNFLNEIRTDYYLFENKNDKNKQITNEIADKGCTTVLINRKDENILSLLHNEDHSIGLYHGGFLLEADIQSTEYENGKRQSPNEKFLAFCCAGSIPGNAFNVNQYGFVFSINALFPNYVGYGRIPRQIIFRTLLSIKNQQDLDELFSTVPVAFGFSINGGFLEKNYLFNYEIGPNLNIENKNYVNKCLILNNQQTNNEFNAGCTIVNYLIHYNHYERLNNLIVEQQTLESTFYRSERGQQFGQILTIDDALRLLGDNENQFYPIFRCPNDINHDTVTLSTVHINFLTLQFIVYEHNPKENNQPTFIYDSKNLLT